ncbi:carbohydrate ABC transporter permease [bacterium]|nr:carbohydrate ABC transporter permease [bacterium]
MKRYTSKRRNLKKYGKLVTYILLSVGLVPMVFPYIWMVLASFKVPAEIFDRFIPSCLTLEHYRMIFLMGSTGSTNPFIRALVNSLIVSSITTLSVVIFGAITGYALARLRFQGRILLKNFIIFQMLFPVVLFLIPRFILVIKLGWINTYLGMMAPFIMSAWAIFLFSQFFRTIPQALIDAARIDGCSELRIIFTIMLPLSKSVTIIVAVFTFMAMWDEFLWYLIVTKDYNLMPLSVLLGLFTKGEYSSYPGIQTAGGTLLTIPILVIFFLFRKFFTEGIALSGIKG